MRLQPPGSSAHSPPFALQIVYVPSCISQDSTTLLEQLPAGSSQTFDEIRHMDFYLPAMPAMVDAVSVQHVTAETNVISCLVGLRVARLAQGQLK